MNDTSDLFADKTESCEYSSDEVESSTTESSDDDIDVNAIIKQYKLDKSWLRDHSYFKNTPVTTVTIINLYVNLDNEIIFKKCNKISLENNCIRKERLINLINSNKIHNNTRYCLNAILKYNFDINSQEITNFIKPDHAPKSYLTNHNHLYDIKFNDTMPYFYDMNSILILYKASQFKNNSHTKKIFINKKVAKTKRKRT